MASVIIYETNFLAIYEIDISTINPTGNTVIRFQLPAVTGRAILKVTDAQGHIVRTLDLGRLGAGLHEAELDVSNLESGIYSYTLEAGEFLKTKKMIVKQ